MSAKKTYAILGCGMMGREHMRNIALVGGAELVAIADPDEGSRAAANSLAAELGQQPAFFADAGKMLAVDGVAIRAC